MSGSKFEWLKRPTETKKLYNSKLGDSPAGVAPTTYPKPIIKDYFLKSGDTSYFMTLKKKK